MELTIFHFTELFIVIQLSSEYDENTDERAFFLVRPICLLPKEIHWEEIEVMIKPDGLQIHFHLEYKNQTSEG